jgi:hypothetical protein
MKMTACHLFSREPQVRLSKFQKFVPKGDTVLPLHKLGIYRNGCFKREERSGRYGYYVRRDAFEHGLNNIFPFRKRGPKRDFL